MCEQISSGELAPSFNERFESLEAAIEQESPGRHFKTALKCGGCKTRITYVDEIPPWRQSAAQAELITEANLWLAENDGEMYMPHFRAMHIGEPDLEWERFKREWDRFEPVLITRSTGFGTTAIGVQENVDLRCVGCPICDQEVFLAEDTVDP